MKKLASGRNPNWAWMDRFAAPNYDDPTKNYLVRWRVIQTPWFGLYVHRFEGPDPRRTLHNHPWTFLSIILSGKYIERRLDPLTMKVRPRIVRRFNLMRRSDYHAITHVEPHTWSLLFVGPRKQTWGYLERLEHSGAVGEWLFTEFDKHRHSAEFGAALAARKRILQGLANGNR